MQRRLTILAACCMLLALGAFTPVAAQVTTFYVSPSGDYSKNGMSWANAKNNLQDAINTLHNYMTSQGLSKGRIFVAAGTYVPDESTETLGGNVYYSAFKIYEGISIYGGFAADETNDDISPDDRLVTYTDGNGEEQTTTISQSEVLHVKSWNLTHRTILDGNLSQASTTFTWSSSRNRYETTFPGNAYHVVWFATNGFYDDDDFPGYARPLNNESVLDGVTIRNGNANNKSASLREHTSYGGGVYMVKNSTLRNCRIEQCASTRRGGGVYMDGGGNVDHCYVTKCQSTGLGIIDGYGGGICGDYGGTVQYSVVDHCLARFGGGLALSYEAVSLTEGSSTTLSYPAAYGGSDYNRLYKMYAIGCVIANNTSTSEAGGVALIQGGALNHCTIVNNACVGIDVSYGGRRYGRSGGLYIDLCGEVYNSALWGNSCPANNNIQYAAHISKVTSDPRLQAGFSPHLYYVGVINHDLTNWNGTTKNNVYSLERENVRPDGAEYLNTHYVFFRTPSAVAGAGDATPNVDWTPRGLSSLNKKGVQVSERSSDVTYLNLAHTSKDYLGYIFEPVSTLGALVEAKEVVSHVLMDPIDPLPAGRSYTQIPTIFVYADRHLPGTHPANEAVGLSWTLPLDNLSKAIQYFDEHCSNRLVNPNAEEDKLGTAEYFTFGGVRYYEVQILVKEGLLNTAGPSSYDDDALRTAAIRPESGMRFYGGYSATLTGTDITSVPRNPKLYPSRITADIIEAGYDKNSVHVVSLTNTANVIIDGFQLYYGRAVESSGLAMSNGGGIIVSNRLTGITNPDPVVEESMRAVRRVPMTGNQLRNCVIANCYGDGSAIFVNGAYKTAELSVVNCIIHNNTALASSGTVVASGGEGSAHLVMDHCDIFNNVGYALVTREANSSIRVDNSAIYANNGTALDDRSSITTPLVTLGSNITGSYNLIDRDGALNGFSDGTSRAIFTYRVSDGTMAYPAFVNPTRNVGHSEDGDQTMYGGNADWMPLSVNPMTNQAGDRSTATDLTCVETRNRGGVADVGALENTYQPEFGAVIYVTPEGAGLKDGSSWSNAIAGNSVYEVGASYVNEGSVALPVLVPTTSSKYVGFAQMPMINNNQMTTTYNVTKHVTEKTYVDGVQTPTTNVLDEYDNFVETLDPVIDDAGAFYDNSASCPYGEISGASLPFWKTNTVTGTTTANISITNNRTETYVGGLQFAVEKAATLNSPKSSDYVQVWVGCGTYSDYKGFVIRDKVKVFGGFPIRTIPNPGEKERVALMDSDIPKSEKRVSLSVADYQTTLQISDVNPRGADNDFNDAVRLTNDCYIVDVDNTQTINREETVMRNSYTSDNDISGVLVNGGMVGNSTGWTTDGFGTLKDKGWANEKWGIVGEDGSFTSGIWRVWSGGDITNSGSCSQEVNLPAGTYMLSALVLANHEKNSNEVEGVSLFAGANTVTASTGSVPPAPGSKNMSGVGNIFKRYQILFTLDVAQTISIGLRYDVPSQHRPNFIAITDVRIENNFSFDEVTNTIDGVPVAGASSSLGRFVKQSPLRKHVLRQPDVCLPTWSPGRIPGEADDNLSNVDRYNRTTHAITPGSNYVAYTLDGEGYPVTEWNGFTIQNGYIYGCAYNRDGGGGARLFNGVVLNNCVVKDNYYHARRIRAGGIYLDGFDSRIQNCFVIDNVIKQKDDLYEYFNNNDAYGSGAYIICGTSYNSLYANNMIIGKGSGGGIFLESATFFNNTIAYNTPDGIYHFDGGSRPNNLEMYNCLVYGNAGKAVISGRVANMKLGNFTNNYIQTTTALDASVQEKFVGYGNQVGTDLSSPFASPNAQTENNFRLALGSACVNTGVNVPVNKDGVAVNLPDNDVDYMERVQDCMVDIGAYEYNGASLITPTLDEREGSPTEGAYVLYVTQNGRQLSSGNNPENAACMQKVQKILDAAGRYKYMNPTHRVVVKLAGIPDGGYAPRRSSLPYANQEENPRDYSFLIPRGVELWGGYTDDYVDADHHGFLESARDVIGHKTLLSGVYQSEEQEVTTYHVLTFTDYIFNENGVVVKRVDDDWQPAIENDLSDATLLSEEVGDNLGDDVRKYARAVVDGVYIEGGRANGLKAADKIGGACVVPAYGHVRNCIVQNNEATIAGGGLYLQQQALVSGCVIQNNEAERGGGIFVYEPTASELEALELEETDSITFAHVISSTIVRNTASTLGGGIRFESNLRANSTVFWMNQANDEIDVSGLIDTGKEQSIKNYPLSYCAVKSVRVAGVSNIEVDGESQRGVRWIRDNNQEDDNYYDIMKSSALARAGMSYGTWTNFHKQFPSLEVCDLAGIDRGEYSAAELAMRGNTLVSGRVVTLVEKDNEYIEIGARAENYLFQVEVSPENLMTRLFVTHSVDLNTDAAEYMQVQEDNEYYQQIGSSFANPMQRLSDAFQYIINARKTLDGEGHYVNSNRRFEVFIAGGTYFPYVAADGTQNHARAATFLIPEGVTLVGGITPEHQHAYYCQETSDEDQEVGKVYSFTIPATGETITLEPMTTEDIKEGREVEDINQNGIIAPWELKNQSILSGQTVNEDVQENVYHVITCLADQQLVGGLPTMYSDEDCTVEVGSRVYESRASLARRAIIIDGVTITEGSAMGYDAGNMLNEHDFYRGGAIMVDGNWNSSTVVDGVYQPILGTEDSPNARGVRDIPLVINDCQFVNNKANHGGALFSNGTVRIFSSNFVQNETDCPSKAAAASLVRYSGGGAVAVNGDFMAVNTIFANNEASKSVGTYDIISGTGNTGTANVPDVEDPTIMHTGINIDGRYLQGFGAVIWGGTESRLRLLNCNLVRNRAVVYPAVFNMVPNSVNPEDKLVHYAVNSIFWGNEAQRTKFASPRLMNYGEVYDLAHATRDDAAECILFSAYPEGRGLPAHSNVKNDLTDYHAMPFDDSPLRGYFQRKDASGHFLDENGDVINPSATRYEQLSASEQHRVVQYNHNVILSQDNSAIDGPNFVYPTTIAGIAGYMPSADWQLLRVNSLVDNGWTMMNQTITQHIAGDGTVTYTCEFKDENYLDEPDDSKTADTRGIYKYHARRENQYFKSGGEPLIVMDMGTTWTTRTGLVEHTHNTPYMRYVSDHANKVYRISPHEDYSAADFNNVPAYIDIGVYEYQHLKLRMSEDADLDVAWVIAPPEGHEMTSTEVDGTRDKPYPDLQTAINDLLRHRNNHPKLIKLGQGTYQPVVIDVRDDNDGVVLHHPTCDGDLVTGLDEDDNTIMWGIKSLTIRGGYKVDANGHGVEECDPDAYPSIIKAVNYGNHRNQQVLIDIKDVENKMTEFSTASGQTLVLRTNGRPIPIILENLSLTSDQAMVLDDEMEDDMEQVQPSAVHYKPQYVTAKSGDRYVKTSTLLLPAEDGQPKLTIRNCQFNRCVDQNNLGVTTVGIEGGGGAALMVNTVIHHSSGRPLAALNTQVVNCTFACNGRHMRLASNTERGTAYQSALHNSVVWLDDQRSDVDPSDPMVTTKSDYEFMTADADACRVYGATPVDATGASYITGNALSRLASRDDVHNNDPLSSDNDDLASGPSFNAPEQWDPENGKYGDFSILPNLTLLSKANVETYKTVVRGMTDYSKALAIVTGYDETEDDQVLMLQGDKLNAWTALAPVVAAADEMPFKLFAPAVPVSLDLDASGHSRLVDALDRGAYECHALLNRVAYVKPSSFKADQGGTSWYDAYGNGELQKAINSVAVYEYINGKSGYVFVQGGGTPENITLREGVEIYGSLPGSTNVQVQKAGEDYTDEEIADYIENLRSIRTGLVSSETQPTLIHNLSGDLNYQRGALIDGFKIEPSGEDVLTSSPVNVSAASGLVVVRNVLIDGFHVEGAPVVKLSGGLLYNALIRDNYTTVPAGSAPAVVEVSGRGRMLNCTVAAARSGQSTIEAHAPVGSPDAPVVLNTIAYNTADREAQTLGEATAYGNCYEVPVAKPTVDYTWHTFAPYLRGSATSYGNFNENRNLWYQLHEKSQNMNTGTNDTGAGNVKTLLDNDFQRSAVDFVNDLDVLGNPRLIAGQVDRGCFETCHVKASDGVVVIDKQSNNHAGQYYPHPGSVFYLLEGATCVMRVGDFTTPLQPGYLLMKDGASLYVNGSLTPGLGGSVTTGNRLLLNHVAVERKIMKRQQLMSLPFDVHPSVTSAPVYQSSYDALVRNDGVSYTPYEYNGELRSRYHGFAFSDDASDCWSPIDAETIPANMGWLMDMGSDFTAPGVGEEPGTIRFTAIGANATDFVYREGEEHKTVVLTQHDDRASTGGAGDFTAQENMGWNLVGMPYLLNGYKTYALDASGDYDSGSEEWQLYAPKTYYTTDEHDQYYGLRSWDNGATMVLGTGYFMQTATLSASEAITYKLPFYSLPSLAKPMHYALPFEHHVNATSGYKVWSNGERLYVSGLQDGDNISLYTISALPVCRDKASAYTWSCPVRAGVYVIKINGYTKTISIKR